MTNLSKLKLKHQAAQTRGDRDLAQTNGDEAIRQIGRYLGAMLADAQPTTAKDMLEILALAKVLRSASYSQGFKTHVARVLDAEASEL